MLRSTSLAARLAVVALLVAGCQAEATGVATPVPTRAPAAEPAVRSRFALSDETFAAVRDNERLAIRLAGEPYAYFRFRADSFTEAVCEAFADQRTEMPLVNLHGDAHLEQYAVTHDAQGLDDFDEAGFGPAPVDLVRFAASIHFACEVVECDADRLVRVFLDRYQTAVEAAEPEAETPAIAARVRHARGADRAAFLAWGDDQMQPVDDSLAPQIEAAWSATREILAASDDRPGSFYDLVRFGALQLGIGSALTPKFLLRVQGPTDGPDDDLLVEIKQHAPAERTSCVFHPPTGGVLYPQVMQQRLGRSHPEVLAFVPHVEVPGADEDDWLCWVHSWDAGYRELGLSDYANEGELQEVIEDVATQLGQGHPRFVTAPLEAQHRAALARSHRALRARVAGLAERLHDEVRDAWRDERLRLEASSVVRR